MSRLAGAEAEWLLVSLENLIDCKLESAELDAILAAYDAGILALESGIEELDGRLEVFEDDWWVLQMTEQYVKCKMGSAEFNTLLAGYDTAFLALLSDIEVLDGRLGSLENGLSQELC